MRQTFDLAKYSVVYIGVKGKEAPEGKKTKERKHPASGDALITSALASPYVVFGLRKMKMGGG